jgi:hypothetical protein
VLQLLQPLRAVCPVLAHYMEILNSLCQYGLSLFKTKTIIAEAHGKHTDHVAAQLRQ